MGLHHIYHVTSVVTPEHSMLGRTKKKKFTFNVKDRIRPKFSFIR